MSITETKLFTHMSIGIDLTSKIAHLHTGMANSLHSYLKEVKNYLGDGEITLFVTKNNEPDFIKYKCTNISIVVTEADKVVDYCSKLDAIHLPFNESKEFSNCKKIITVYDLIPEHFPCKFPKSTIESMRRATHEADFIMTISEYSKQDIIKRHKINPHKIKASLIPFFSDEYQGFEYIDVKSKYNLPDGDLLFYPAAGRPHKNHSTLFEALNKLPKEVTLVLTTGESHGSVRLKELALEAASYGVKDRVLILGKIPRLDYLNLFTVARALVFPSAAEGYGLPVVESLALKCPIIASNSTCLPEIAGAAALYFDTYDSDELVEKVSELLGSQTLSDNLIRQGELRFKELSNKKLYSGLVEVYQSAVSFFRKAANEKKQLSMHKSNDLITIRGLASSSSILHTNGFYDLRNHLLKVLYKQPFIPRNSSLKQSSEVIINSSVNHLKQPCDFVLMLDCSRLLSSSMFSGISRYVFRILQYLSSLSNLNVIPIFNDKSRGVPKIHQGKKTVTFNWEDSTFDLLHYSVALPFARSFNKPIVYHSPYHPLPNQREADLSYVITLCDIFHVTFSHFYNSGFKYITRDIVDSINIETDEIMCISRFTADDVKKYFGGGLITFSPLAPFDINPVFDKSIDRPYLLIPFQNDPRKGADKMLAAAELWLQKTEDSKVVIYGKISNLTNEFVEKNKDKIELIESPSDDELVGLYKQSFAFLYLSELEGFGMPPLEAMQYGCAPIILENSSLAEIYMGWEYLLPNSAKVEDIVDALSKIKNLSMSELLPRISKVLDRYSWDICGATHVASYLRTLN